MKPASKPSTAPSWRLYLCGWVVLVAVAGLAFLTSRESTSSARGPESGLHAGTVAATPISVPDSTAPLAGGMQGVKNTLSLTHTVFLPLVFKDYWWVPDSLFGVQLFGSGRPQEAVLKARASGARWARVPFSWSQIEPQNTTPENYQWPAVYDDWLARLSAQGIRPIVMFGGNPPWASPYPGGPITETAVISELVEFMEAAVAHYGGSPYNVKHWEFYNEPDNGSEFYAEYGWGYWGNEPASYAAMLEAVYQPVKAVDPEAQIVLGGLAYDWFTTEGGPFVQGFLDGVLESGGGAYFDLMNFHYYPPFRSRWDPYGPGLVGKATYLRNKLAEYGVDKPVICTETGIWSEEGNSDSRELQSRAVPQLYAQSIAADLKISIWFTFIDGGGLESWKWGLLDVYLNPKPAYSAYRTAVKQLAQASDVQLLTVAETASKEIEAYRFLADGGSTWIIVAWTNDDLAHEMTFGASEVVVVDKFGTETLVRDGDDGSMDLLVRLSIKPSPVYIRVSH